MSENSKARGGAGMSGNRAKLVRARLKREGLPEWFICCPDMQRRVKKEIAANKVFLVDPKSSFIAEVECSACGRIAENILYIRTVGKRRTMIAIDAYDLDEGVTQ